MGAGILLLISGLFHVVVWAANGFPSLQGPVTWRKPIEFGMSGAITTLSLAWVLGRLPRSRLWDWVAAIAIVFFVPETVLIDVQQWRGVPSHFNYATPFDAAVFSAMGIFIGIVAMGIAIIAARSFLGVAGPPSTALAVRTGLLFLLVGQVLGGLILANQFGSDGPLANASIVGVAGELKVPHALALHGLQVLAVLALILERAAVSSRTALTAVASCAAGYALVLAAATLQTYAGIAPLAFTPLGLVASLAGVLLIAGPYLRGVIALRSPSLA
ncbi:MAG TPA: hypothetical protein VJP45_11185 [Candidatus Limnocylindria bacterium]|nr:hypothetical protein [Candidatus Limnocylindria bacterium]